MLIHAGWRRVQCPIFQLRQLQIFFYFDWVSRFGAPLFLITDKGRQFTGEIMKLLNKKLGIYHIRTGAYNPTSNGQIERQHRIFKSVLKAKGGEWLT